MAIYLAHSNAHDSAFDDAWPLSPFFDLDLPTFGHALDETATADTVGLSNLSEFARWAKMRIDDIYDRVRLMARGVDMGAYDKFSAIAPRPTIMASGLIRFHGNLARGSPTADNVRFCIDTVIDSTLAMRSNRPPARNRAETTELRVIRNTDVIVYPATTSPEIIRPVLPGEILRTPSRPRLLLDGDYVAILQDGDVAYVSRHCVEATSPDSSAGIRLIPEPTTSRRVLWLVEDRHTSPDPVLTDFMVATHDWRCSESRTRSDSSNQTIPKPSIAFDDRRAGEVSQETHD